MLILSVRSYNWNVLRAVQSNLRYVINNNDTEQFFLFFSFFSRIRRTLTIVVGFFQILEYDELTPSQLESELGWIWCERSTLIDLNVHKILRTNICESFQSIQKKIKWKPTWAIGMIPVDNPLSQLIELITKLITPINMTLFIFYAIKLFLFCLNFFVPERENYSFFYYFYYKYFIVWVYFWYQNVFAFSFFLFIGITYFGIMIIHLMKFWILAFCVC